jgi:hypothetical protein
MNRPIRITITECDAEVSQGGELCEVLEKLDALHQLVQRAHRAEMHKLDLLLELLQTQPTPHEPDHMTVRFGAPEPES